MSVAVGPTEALAMRSACWFTFAGVLGLLTACGGDSTTSNEGCSTLPGLAAWWAGDGNANDLVGAAHGVLTGDVSFTSGFSGDAFVLDGAGDYVGAPFSYYGPFAVSLWAMPESVPQAQFTSLLSSAGPGNYNPHFQIQFDASGDYEFHAGGQELFVPIGTPSLTWQHVVVVYDGADAITYFDGAPTSSGTWSGLGTDLGFESVKIGINRDTNFGFTGLVDEVEVYTRALTAAEVRTIFDAGPTRCKG